MCFLERWVPFTFSSKMREKRRISFPSLFFFFFVFCLFVVVVVVVIVAISWAAPAAYGGSQARG